MKLFRLRFFIDLLGTLFFFNKVSKKEKEDNYRYEYMMLSRLQSDFRAFFGKGDEENDKWDCRYKNEKQIWSGSIKDLFAEMKRLYRKIPRGIKPEWCTKKQMKRYKYILKQQS